MSVISSTQREPLLMLFSVQFGGILKYIPCLLVTTLNTTLHSSLFSLLYNLYIVLCTAKQVRAVEVDTMVYLSQTLRMLGFASMPWDSNSCPTGLQKGEESCV